jgi:hypothetical protein
LAARFDEDRVDEVVGAVGEGEGAVEGASIVGEAQAALAGAVADVLADVGDAGAMRCVSLHARR